jgi:hypothetical protein
MAIDVAALLEPGVATAPVVGGQADLAELHRQLVNQSVRGAHWLEAAEVIATLSMALHNFPAADARTVNLVVASVIDELRGTIVSERGSWRFATARAWLDNLRIQARAAKTR